MEDLKIVSALKEGRVKTQSSISVNYLELTPAKIEFIVNVSLHIVSIYGNTYADPIYMADFIFSRAEDAWTFAKSVAPDSFFGFHTSPDTKDYVKQRDKGICQYCGIKVHGIGLPQAKESKTNAVSKLHTPEIKKEFNDFLWAIHTPHNLLLACNSCNASKGNRGLGWLKQRLAETGKEFFGIEHWHTEVCFRLKDLIPAAKSLYWQRINSVQVVRAMDGGSHERATYLWASKLAREQGIKNDIFETSNYQLNGLEGAELLDSLIFDAMLFRSRYKTMSEAATIIAAIEAITNVKK